MVRGEVSRTAPSGDVRSSVAAEPATSLAARRHVPCWCVRARSTNAVARRGPEQETPIDMHHIVGSKTLRPSRDVRVRRSTSDFRSGPIDHAASTDPSDLAWCAALPGRVPRQVPPRQTSGAGDSGVTRNGRGCWLLFGEIRVMTQRSWVARTEMNRFIPFGTPKPATHAGWTQRVARGGDLEPRNRRR